MRENKKSFILHNDSLEILSELTNEEAGILFKAITSFNIGKKIELDKSMRMLFLPFKNQFIRDIERYKNKSEINSINGSKGGLAKVAKATKRKQTLKGVAILADNDNDNDSDSDSDSDNVTFDTFWNLYNRKVGAKHKCIKKWEMLSNEERKKIIDTLPVFISAIKDKQFQPFPETYLNQKRWNDEIIKPELKKHSVPIKYLQGDEFADDIKLIKQTKLETEVEIKIGNSEKVVIYGKLPVLPPFSSKNK